MEYQSLLNYHLEKGWKLKRELGSKYVEILSSDGKNIRTIQETELNKSELLVKFIRQNNFKRMAEIGVSPGGNAKYLLAKVNLQPLIMVERLPVKKLWGILLETDEAGLDKEGRTRKPYVLMRMLAEEAHKIIAEGCLDIVYIDCQHAYLNVKDDIKNWKPKIRKGGILAGHDYNPWGVPNASGVAKAVDEAFPSVNLVVDVPSHNCNWWLKI